MVRGAALHLLPSSCAPWKGVERVPSPWRRVECRARPSSIKVSVSVSEWEKGLHTVRRFRRARHHGKSIVAALLHGALDRSPSPDAVRASATAGHGLQKGMRVSDLLLVGQSKQATRAGRRGVRRREEVTYSDRSLSTEGGRRLTRQVVWLCLRLP